uniref:Uncharacterized protein n=1 Tax=Nelumbo nucifera TaxID=4432 RepID=A0A822YZ93_NELNU|nr:TPA_asm: hypothetical protein HUJ06_008471 [Nelumbo nucifera]
MTAQRESSPCPRSIKETPSVPANTQNPGQGRGSREIELRDVQSNLHSLKKLYGLLLVEGNDDQKASSTNLDEKARLLLKKLLDGAAEQVLQSHSKIMAQQSVAVKPERSQGQLKLQSVMGTPETSPMCIRNKDLNCHPATLQVDQSEFKQTLLSTIPGLPVLKFSATTAENRSKQYQGCEKRRLKRLDSTKDKKVLDEAIEKMDKPRDEHLHLHNFDHHSQGDRGPVKDLESKQKTSKCEKPRMKRVREIQRNLSTVSSILDPMGSPAMWVRSESQYNHSDKNGKKDEKNISLPDEVAIAIQRLEACILGDQELTRNVTHCHQSCRTINSINDADILDQLVEKKDGATQTSGPIEQDLVMNQTTKSVLDGNYLPSLRMSHKRLKHKDATLHTGQMSQSCNPVAEKIEVLNQLTSKKDGKAKQNTLTDQLLVNQESNQVPACNDFQSRRLSQMGGKNKETALPDQLLSQTPKIALKINDSLSQVTGQKDRRNMVVTMTNASESRKLDPQRNELSSQIILSQKDQKVCQSSKPIQEKHLLPSQKVGFPAHGKIKDRPTNKTMKITTSKPLKPSHHFVGPTLILEDLVDPHPKKDQRSEKIERRSSKLNQKMMDRSRSGSKKDKPHEVISRPTMRDHQNQMAISPSPSKAKDPLDRPRMRSHKISQMAPQRMNLPRQHEATSDSFSSWTSQQQSSTTTGEREDDPPPQQRIPMQHTARSPSWHVGPTSRMRRNLSREKGIQENSPPPCHMRRRYITAESSSSCSDSPPDRKIGRLRRLKNKLAIIFHHHHHHHHHHHNKHDNDGDEFVKGHRSLQKHHGSLWKHLGKILRHSSKAEDHGKLMAEVCGEHAAENFTRSKARNMPRKAQQGHLHALVEGLLRHIWHRKKSKPSMTNIKRLGEAYNGKGDVKKLHWWQNFHKRGGLKLANKIKPRIRLGFRAKKPQLRDAHMR